MCNALAAPRRRPCGMLPAIPSLYVIKPDHRLARRRVYNALPFSARAVGLAIRAFICISRRSYVRILPISCRLSWPSPPARMRSELFPADKLGVLDGFARRIEKSAARLSEQFDLIRDPLDLDSRLRCAPASAPSLLGSVSGSALWLKPQASDRLPARAASSSGWSGIGSDYDLR